VFRIILINQSVSRFLRSANKSRANQRPLVAVTLLVFFMAAALLAMQSAVLATAIPSICPYVHARIVPRRLKIGSCGFHCVYQRAIDAVRTLPLSPPKGVSKSKFVIFVNISEFKSNSNKLCYKVF